MYCSGYDSIDEVGRQVEGYLRPAVVVSRFWYHTPGEWTIDLQRLGRILLLVLVNINAVSCVSAFLRASERMTKRACDAILHASDRMSYLILISSGRLVWAVVWRARSIKPKNYTLIVYYNFKNESKWCNTLRKFTAKILCYEETKHF